MKRQFLAICLTLGLATPAHAEEDVQAWPVLLMQGKLTGDVLFWLEAQPRVTDGASRLGQVLVRTAVGAPLGKRSSLLAGYVFVRTDPATRPATTEHRIWQQLIVPLSRPGAPLTLTARTRFEQRMVEGSGDVGLRLRQFVRAQHKLAPDSKVSGVVWGEGFYSLNGTGWGQRAGWDQARGFAGISIPVTKQITLEPGYLNQTLFRPGPNRVNHIANLWLVVRL